MGETALPATTLLAAVLASAMILAWGAAVSLIWTWEKRRTPRKRRYTQSEWYEPGVGIHMFLQRKTGGRGGRKEKNGAAVMHTTLTTPS